MRFPVPPLSAHAIVLGLALVALVATAAGAEQVRDGPSPGAEQEPAGRYTDDAQVIADRGDNGGAPPMDGFDGDDYESIRRDATWSATAPAAPSPTTAGGR